MPPLQNTTIIKNIIIKKKGDISMSGSRANTEVRALVKCSGVKYQDIARELDISECYLSRLMSKPLTEVNKRKICNVVAILVNNA